MIEVIMLGAVGIEAAKAQQQGQLRHRADPPGGDAVQVAPEHAGVAEGAQQDQPVGRGLEPAVDPALQGLAGLGIVIIHKGHGLMGPRSHQRAVEEVRHVVVAAGGAGVPQVGVEGHVEQVHGAVHLIQVVVERPHVMVPVLPHGVQLPAGVGAHGRQPVPVKGGGNVLHRVQAEAVHPGQVGVPAAPGLHLLQNLRGLEVHIRPHQVVVVVLLPVNIVGPALALDEENTVLPVQIVPVRAGEALCVPPEAAVLPPPPWEMEPGEQPHLPALAHGLQPVVPVHADGLGLIRAVGAHAVVQHQIRQGLHTGVLQGADGGQVFVLRAVLGADAALLVELAQVVQVVYAVAHVASTAAALEGRGQPRGGEALPVQRKGMPGQIPPQLAVRRRLPLEALEHHAVVHGGPPSFGIVFIRMIAHFCPSAKQGGAGIVYGGGRHSIRGGATAAVRRFHPRHFYMWKGRSA